MPVGISDDKNKIEHRRNDRHGRSGDKTRDRSAHGSLNNPHNDYPCRRIEYKPVHRIDQTDPSRTPYEIEKRMHQLTRQQRSENHEQTGPGGLTGDRPASGHGSVLVSIRVRVCDRRASRDLRSGGVRGAVSPGGHPARITAQRSRGPRARDGPGGAIGCVDAGGPGRPGELSRPGELGRSCRPGELGRPILPATSVGFTAAGSADSADSTDPGIAVETLIGGPNRRGARALGGTS